MVEHLPRTGANLDSTSSISAKKTSSVFWSESYLSLGDQRKHQVNVDGVDEIPSECVLLMGTNASEPWELAKPLVLYGLCTKATRGFLLRVFTASVWTSWCFPVLCGREQLRFWFCYIVAGRTQAAQAQLIPTCVSLSLFFILKPQTGSQDQAVLEEALGLLLIAAEL